MEPEFAGDTVQDVLDVQKSRTWEEFAEWHTTHFPQLGVKSRSDGFKIVKKLRSRLQALQRNKDKEGAERFLKSPYMEALQPALTTQQNEVAARVRCECEKLRNEIKAVRQELYLNLQKASKEEKEKEELKKKNAFMDVELVAMKRELKKVQNSTVSNISYAKKEKELDRIKSDLKETKKKVTSLKKHNLARSLRRANKRHITQRENWRQERKILHQRIRELETKMVKDRSEFAKRKVMLKRSKKTAQATASYRKKEVEKYRERAKSLKEKIQTLEEEKKVQQEKVEELEQKIEAKEDGQKVNTRIRDDVRAPFKDSVKQCVMELQGMQVGSNKVPGVIEAVARNIFDVKFTAEDLPQKSTTCNLAAQAFYLGRRHVAEKLALASNWDLHTDATSRDGHHVFNYQCVTKDEQFSLGYLPVAEETASSVLDSVQAMMSDLANLHPREDATVHQNLLEGLRNTMTDRCAVMKLFTEKLATWKKEELQKCNSPEEKHGINSFFCTAHFLLGLSHHATQALKEHQTTMEMAYGPLGRDSLTEFKMWRVGEPAVVRLVRTACEALGPRGDQKSGCRGDWVAWVQQLPPTGKTSTIISFKSNRFNNLFLGAATIFHHHKDIQQFFSSGVLTKDNKLLRSISEDISSAPLLAGVRALGIFYHRVSGPIWDMIESPKVHILDMHKHIQTLHQNLRAWVDDASPLLKPDTHDLFTDFPPSKSPNFDALYAATELNTLTQEILEVISASSLFVTQKQLADFLEGGKYSEEPSEALRGQTEQTRKSNLIGENDFGDFDWSIKQKPNAHLLHHSSVLMTKRNKTFQWVDGKDTEEKQQLLKDAQKMAPQIREKDRAQWEAVQQKKQMTLAENKRRKEEKERRRIETMQALIDKVHDHGGPCRTTDDIDRVIEGSTEGRKCVILGDELKYYQKVLSVAGKQQDFTVSAEGKKLSSEVLKRKLSTILSRTTEPAEPEVPQNLVDMTAPERRSKVNAVKSLYLQKVENERVHKVAENESNNVSGDNISGAENAERGKKRKRVTQKKDTTKKTAEDVETENESNNATGDNISGAESAKRGKKRKRVTQKKDTTEKTAEAVETEEEKGGKKRRRVTKKKGTNTSTAEPVPVTKEPISYKPGDCVAVWYTDRNGHVTWYPGAVVADGAETVTINYFHPVAGGMYQVPESPDEAATDKLYVLRNIEILPVRGGRYWRVTEKESIDKICQERFA